MLDGPVDVNKIGRWLLRKKERMAFLRYCHQKLDARRRTTTIDFKQGLAFIYGPITPVSALPVAATVPPEATVKSVSDAAPSLCQYNSYT